MEIDRNGSEIIRSFDPSTDRYAFDFGRCCHTKGWKQWDTDQDASYFGVWVHPEKMQVITYAEGDIVQVKCPSMAAFKQELQAMADCYGNPPPFATAIARDGSVTKYYDTRYMGAE